ncbi:MULTISPECIES: protein translocase subunit SecD [unclassified Arsukibacterium]|mgnify:CR=1 FL=1|uniref:protein translocase subunit SecD n=1 Tax=unclassified Arsukibacterium TaxID=2635278 RepID=UPI000C901F26|nr:MULTISPECIES: protein translocase subunit SecD [unclassified Arsukibacterium]MAA96517.1 protein translocase subunit SecD [Rheinheimera sp.]HAW94218.1 protein translocase subunit SecD [Candidatus Azambacteria bacterium]|tara:strand:- start:21450 stop:23303 length:1854 start_codon:yes stop_codon:yes gene_type:complete
MLNKNPAWRYLVVIGMLLLTLLYALPNLYPEEPALNISASRGGTITEPTRLKLEQSFIDAGITATSVALQDGKIIARFSNAEQQLQALDQAKNVLGTHYTSALSLMPATPAWLTAIGATPMKLGLDLRGGVHFLLAVDMQAALDKHLNDMVSAFRSDLRQADIRYLRVKADLEQGQITLSFRQSEDLKEATTLLSQQDNQFVITDDAENLSLLVSLSEERQREIRNYALEQNITIMRNRVNEIGVAESVVQRQGADRIVVQLPGVQDTAQAKEILSATATLEFRLVDTDSDLAAAVAGRLSANADLYHSADGRPVLLEKRVLLTGDHIIDAVSGYDEYSQPQVNIKLDTAGGNLMSEASKSAVGRRMATVFIEYKPGTELNADGTAVLVKQQEVINDATITMRLGRDFVITGLGSPAEAQHLASLLRAGALIAPIQVIEERTIGPSLGKENIALGLAAIQWGLAAVVLFMLVYYKAFGLVANVALAANLVLIVGFLSMIPGATLTLPGMAGIVLTVGMAVDANVLIFERIREELAEGRSVQQAINLGYERAFSTIADSNITTLLVALILFGVGSGPVKGFAITLAIGILTSIFTAVVGTRLLVNLFWGGRRLQSLPL